MKNKFTLMLFASIALTSLYISCDKDEDPELIEEQELITTVVLNITSDGAANQTVRWNMDTNQTPTISLQANQQYQVSVSFLDESDPADTEDITEEVKEEAD